METTTTRARRLLAARDSGATLPPLTDADPGFDLAAGTAVSAEITRLRADRGERLVGRKIGFTNRRLWEEYGVRAPIWGPVWDSTCHDAAAPLPLDGLNEPKIEPEIIFRIGATPRPGLAPEALLACLSGLAFGFEVVTSPFPGWRFRPADTVACGALHGALLPGGFHPVAPLARQLDGFRVTLWCNGAVAGHGDCSDVMTHGPLAALAHLVELLAEEGSPPLAPGEMVSTGSLTRAFDVAPGQVWRAELDGLDLPPAEARFA